MFLDRPSPSRIYVLIYRASHIRESAGNNLSKLSNWDSRELGDRIIREIETKVILKKVFYGNWILDYFNFLV